MAGQGNRNQPFLKWAGGKRWLVASYSHLLPDTYNRYFEPFLGSGAVFFHLRPKNGVLSDKNPTLINAFKAIRDEPHRLHRLLSLHQKLHCKNYYYNIREKTFTDPIKTAAQFIYLNRTCWNGLYRVNLTGKFNVPIGTKTSVLLETDNFEAMSKTLRKVRLLASDFEKIIDKSKFGDFVFIDPPYTVKHNINGFVKYNEKLFSWNDQIRLRDSVLRAKARGVKILISNAHHASVIDLYKDIGEKISVARHSILAADKNRRTKVEELLISV